MGETCLRHTNPLLFLLREKCYKLVVDRGKWLRSSVNIEENKRAKIYIGRSLTLKIFCFMLIDYA